MMLIVVVVAVHLVASTLFRVRTTDTEVNNVLNDLGSSCDVWRVGVPNQTTRDIVVRGHPGCLMDRVATQYGATVEPIGEVPQFNDGSHHMQPQQRFHRYRSYRELQARMSGLAVTYPTLCTTHTVGQSFLNDTITALRLSNVNTSDAPEVVYVGAHHAREWISPEVVLGIAELILDHSSEGNISNILNTSVLWFIPVLNPDGYQFTFEPGWESGALKRFWRKNRRGDHLGHVWGVDLNRNYATGWGGPGSSGQRTSDIYRGPWAFSEPETHAFKRFLGPKDQTKPSNEVIRSTVVGLITYHSYGELVMYPPGDRFTSSPNNDFMHQLGEQLSNIMYGVHLHKYHTMKASAMYLAAGDTCDWFHAMTSGRVCYTFELRPVHDMVGFALPSREILPTVEENFPAALHFAQYVVRHADVVDWWSHNYTHIQAPPVVLGVPTNTPTLTPELTSTPTITPHETPVPAPVVDVSGSLVSSNTTHGNIAAAPAVTAGLWLYCVVLWLCFV